MLARLAPREGDHPLPHRESRPRLAGGGTGRQGPQLSRPDGQDDARRRSRTCPRLSPTCGCRKSHVRDREPAGGVRAVGRGTPGSDSLRPPRPLRVSGPGRDGIRMEGGRVTPQRVPLDRRLGPQRLHPPLRRKRSRDRGWRPGAHRRRLRDRLLLVRHHPHLPGQRALHRTAESDLRDRPGCAAGIDRCLAARSDHSHPA